MLLVVCILLTTSLFGCAPAAKPEAPGEVVAPTAASEEKVTLKIMTFDGALGMFADEIEAEWQKTHPNVDIEISVKETEYFTILATMIQSGEAPDLLGTLGVSSSNFSELVKQGYLLPMDDYFNESDYPEWYMNIFTIDGKRYAIPGMIEDSLGTFYNKKVFDQLGLKPPETQADFEVILDTLKKNGIVPISYDGKDGTRSWWAYLVYIQAYAPDWNHEFPKNGKKYSDPEFVDATKQFVRWLKEGYMGDDYLSLDHNSAIVQVLQGKAGMIMTGAWDAPAFEDSPDIDVMFLKRPDGKDAGISAPKQGTSLSVFSQSPNKELAVEFAQFFATKPVQQILANSNSAVPGSFPAAEGITVPNRLLNAFGLADHTDMTYADTAGIIPAEGLDFFSGSADLHLELNYGRITPEEYAAKQDKLLDYSKLDQ
jgi:ABC-type glycerol-3-phosphate transport system substrate-binding protein